MKSYECGCSVEAYFTLPKVSVEMPIEILLCPLQLCHDGDQAPWVGL